MSALDFKIDISDIIGRFRQLPACVDGVTVKLPFLEIALKSSNVEKKVAREVLIRISDRRILNASECCDDCIELAVTSLEEIRQTVVNAQVELSHDSQGGLYLLLDSIRDAIRQFLTFEERLNLPTERDLKMRRRKDMCCPADTRDFYFAALEVLRAHIHRVLLQVSKIADFPIPRIADAMRYADDWELTSYRTLPMPNKR